MITRTFYMQVTLDDRKVSTNNFDLQNSEEAGESLPFFNALDRTLHEHRVDTDFLLYSLDQRLGGILIEEYDMDSHEVFFWLAKIPPSTDLQFLSRITNRGMFLKFGPLL